MTHVKTTKGVCILSDATVLALSEKAANEQTVCRLINFPKMMQPWPRTEEPATCPTCLRRVKDEKELDEAIGVPE